MLVKKFAIFYSLNIEFLNRFADFCKNFENNLVEVFNYKKVIFSFCL